MRLSQKFPELESKYSPLNNTPFNSKEYSSTEKLYWNPCENKKHYSHKTALEFKRFANCSSCQNIAKTQLKYEESFEHLYPVLAKKYSKKNIITPDAITPDSQTKALWIDVEGKMSVQKRVLEWRSKNHIGRYFNNLLKDSHPEVFNMLIEPDTLIQSGSNKKVWWKCNKGHSFESSPKLTVKRKNKCPICSGLILQQGVNDFRTEYPDLAKHIVSPDPKTFTRTRQEDVQAKCKIGHDVNTRISFMLTCKEWCKYCANKKVFKGFNDLLTAMPQVKKYWHEKNILQPDEVLKGSDTLIYLHCSKNPQHVIATRPYILTREKSRLFFACSHCVSSTGEKELASFIESLGFYTINNSRSLIKPLELDVYVPDKGIAFEFNGVYWHSEALGKDKNYHYDKFIQCQEQGVQLIQVWEDDWVNKNEIVKSMIRSKLGKTQAKKIPARKTVFGVVSQSVARDFLEDNHIQGFVKGAKSFGLFYEGELVALMSVASVKNTREIILHRYATKYTVQGGFTRLLKYSLSYFSNFDRVVTFSDNCVSNGLLYSNHGFTLDSYLPPDYKYVVNGCREHKFNYRKSRFKRDPSLIFKDGLSEYELANLNGLNRVYDAGKTRWTLTLK